MTDGRRNWSFAEADVTMRGVAAGLGRGRREGRSACAGRACETARETLLVHAALRELGAVTVPLVPGLTFAELAFQIDHSGEASTLIAGEPITSVLLPRLAELRGVDTVVLADGPRLREGRRCPRPGSTTAGLRSAARAGGRRR